MNHHLAQRHVAIAGAVAIRLVNFWFDSAQTVLRMAAGRRR